MRLRVAVRLRLLGFQLHYVGLAGSRMLRRWQRASNTATIRGQKFLKYVHNGRQSPLAADVRGGHADPSCPKFIFGHHRRTLRWGFDSRLRDFKRTAAIQIGTPYATTTHPGLTAVGSLKFRAHTWTRFLGRLGYFFRR